jgi:hypothetical protein
MIRYLTLRHLIKCSFTSQQYGEAVFAIHQLNFRDYRNPVTGDNDWRPIYERSNDPAERYSETGDPWFIMDMSFRRWVNWGETRWTFFVEIDNVLNIDNSAIVNPVTGKAYKKDYPQTQSELIALRDNRSYDVPNNVKDPRYLDPRDNNIPAYLNPANLLEQRHITFGFSLKF